VVRTIIPIGVEIKNLEPEKDKITSFTEIDKIEETDTDNKEQKEEINGEDLFT